MPSNHKLSSNGQARHVRLTELVEVNPSVDCSHLKGGDEVSFIPMSDVSNNAQWATRQTRSYSDVQSGYSVFAEGDVLFAKITPCTENGKGCHAVNLMNGVGFGSTKFHVLRAKPGVNPRLVFHLSVARDVRAQAAAMMGGSAGQQRVPPDFFKFLLVSSRCLEKQDAYANLFDATEAAIERTREVIGQTRKLKTALLDDLLTNGLPARHTEFKRDYRLGHVPADWKISQILENAEVTQGIALGPHRMPRQNATPYLRVANVQNGFVDSNEIKHIEATEEERTKYALREGDVLIVEGHANIEDLGRAALVPETVAGMVFQNHLFRVRTKPERLDARYLAAWINSVPGRTYFRIFGGTTSGLNTVGSGQIRMLRFPLPPIEEQRVICDLAESTEQRVAALVDELARLQGLKSALCQALLTGRVPLPTKGGE